VLLHLKPASLGSMRVTLDLEQGSASARFEVEHSQARRLLESELPALRAALEARGLHVDRLDVRLAHGMEAGPRADPHRMMHGADAHDNGGGPDDRAGGDDAGAPRGDEDRGRGSASRAQGAHRDWPGRVDEASVPAEADGRSVAGLAEATPGIWFGVDTIA